MWTIRIDRTDRVDVVVVTATYSDGAEIFFHKEAVKVGFDVNEFVNKAISERNSWRDKNSVFANSMSKISEEILNAFHKAEGIKDAELSVVSENGAIIVKNIEVIELEKI